MTSFEHDACGAGGEMARTDTPRRADRDSRDECTAVLGVQVSGIFKGTAPTDVRELDRR